MDVPRVNPMITATFASLVLRIPAEDALAPSPPYTNALFSPIEPNTFIKWRPAVFAANNLRAQQMFVRIQRGITSP